MKYLLSIIVVFNSLTLRAQSQNGPMMLQWNVQDTIFYDVDFGELSVDLDASINNTTYQALDSLAEKIKNEMVKALKDYRLTSSIHPVDSAMEVIFYFNKLPVLKAQVSKSGELLTTVEKQSINFFKFFYELPNQPKKLGDKWASNIPFPKSFRGQTIIDSTRQDQIHFEDLIVTDSSKVAVLKTLVTEKILTSYTDESGKKGKGSYEIVYSSTGHFDVLNGKWIKKEGVIIFEFDIKEKSKQIMSVAMKEL